jgi:hypothetical protein
MAECLIKINSMNLTEPLCHKASFKLCNSAILVGLQLIDPLALNGFSSRGQVGKDPSFILQE